MNISKLNEEAVREILQTIVDKLDELDEEDFFGTEGWKHYFGAGGAKMNDEKKISVPIPSNADRTVEVLSGCRRLLLRRENKERLRILRYLLSEFEEDGNQWGAQE